MSSATSTSSALTQFPSTGISGSNGSGTSRSASYFFGFLVTFAVLLILFVVAGFVSRQRMRRRHAATLEAEIGAGDPWVYGYRERRLYEEARKVRPVWMERWYEDPDTSEKARVDGRTGRWQDMMPLSVTLTRPEHELKPTEGAGEGKSRRSSSSTVSSWLSSLNTTKETDSVQVVDPPSYLLTQDVLHDPEAGVDVVVMIAMPRSPDTRGYEFGIANVPIVGQRVNASIISSVPE